MRRVVIVTGLSGAGKTRAMGTLEDFGFTCSDGVPPVLAGELVALAERSGKDRVAIALDVRTAGAFGDAAAALDALSRDGVRAEILYLEADEATLVRRYSESRRRHPYRDGLATLSEAIAAERAQIRPLRERADVVVDTTDLTHGMLKERLAAVFAGDPADQMAVTVLAFGFKYGLPLDADVVFDARFLPNPYYLPELAPLTGDDPPVAAYLEGLPETEPFIAKMIDLVDFTLPRYRTEGKAQLTIAIGCTGGRHRSVYLGRRLARHLDRDDVAVTFQARDVQR